MAVKKVWICVYVVIKTCYSLGLTIVTKWCIHKRIPKICTFPWGARGDFESCWDVICGSLAISQLWKLAESNLHRIATKLGQALLSNKLSRAFCYYTYIQHNLVCPQIGRWWSRVRKIIMVNETRISHDRRSWLYGTNLLFGYLVLTP